MTKENKNTDEMFGLIGLVFFGIILGIYISYFYYSITEEDNIFDYTLTIISREDIQNKTLIIHTDYIIISSNNINHSKIIIVPKDNRLDGLTITNNTFSITKNETAIRVTNDSWNGGRWSVVDSQIVVE